MGPVILGRVDIGELHLVKRESLYASECLSLNSYADEHRLAVVDDGGRIFSVECFDSPCFKQVLRIRRDDEEASTLEEMLYASDEDAITIVTFTDSGRLTILELFKMIISDSSTIEALLGLLTLVSGERERAGALITNEIRRLRDKIKNKELIVEYGKESRKDNLHSALRSPYAAQLNSSATFVNLDFNRFFSSLLTENGVVIVEVNNENDVPKIIVHSMFDISFDNIGDKLGTLSDIKNTEELIEYMAEDAVAMADDDAFMVSALYEGDLDDLELYGSARHFLSGLVDDSPLLINTYHYYSS